MAVAHREDGCQVLLCCACGQEAWSVSLLVGDGNSSSVQCTDPSTCREEFKAQVEGYSGAVFKKFPTNEEAEFFVSHSGERGGKVISG